MEILREPLLIIIVCAWTVECPNLIIWYNFIWLELTFIKVSNIVAFVWYYISLFCRAIILINAKYIRICGYCNCAFGTHLISNSIRVPCQVSIGLFYYVQFYSARSDHKVDNTLHQYVRCSIVWLGYVWIITSSPYIMTDHEYVLWCIIKSFETCLNRYDPQSKGLQRGAPTTIPRNAYTLGSKNVYLI